MIKKIRAWFAEQKAMKESYRRYEEWARGYNPFTCGYTPKCSNEELPVAPKGGTGEIRYVPTEGN